jgi:addiction module RelE/StbE family toxin
MRLVWLRRALFDLEAIETFIETDNPAAARAMEQRIIQAVTLLMDQPSMGRPGRVADTRELVVSGTPYIVAYSVIAEAVTILAVIHGARQWPERFE